MVEDDKVKEKIERKVEEKEEQNIKENPAAPEKTVEKEKEVSRDEKREEKSSEKNNSDENKGKKEHERKESERRRVEEDNKERKEKKEEKKERKEMREKKVEHKNHKSLKETIRNFYVKKYKVVLAMSFTLFLILFLSIFAFNIQRGYLLNKDISLKGGVVVTLPLKNEADFNVVVSKFRSAFPNKDVTVRLLGTSSKSISVESSDLNKTQILSVLSQIPEFSDVIKSNNYTFITVGSTLGESFFRQTIKAIIWSFILMSIVVLLYFRNFTPSLFVAWNAFSDLTETLAVIVMFNMKFSTASIAALLMLIGYSVDTNILLTSRVLKAARDKVISLIFNSMRTGLAMSLTTMVTTFFAYLVTQSLVIRQIMFILTVGMVFDTINTWLFNAPLLRWYLENKYSSRRK